MKYLPVALTIIAFAVSCTKKYDPPPPENPGAISVRLQLSGDFTVTETGLPTGRKASSGTAYTKTLRDSTVYAVIVYRPNGGFYYDIFSSGLFNQRDSITLLLPKTGTAKISAFALKRGSSEGLFYTMQNGLQAFPYPLQTVMNNQMDSLHRSLQTRQWDTLSSLQVVDPANMAQPLPFADLPELDAYHGSTIFSVTNMAPTLTLPMRRLAFGLKLEAVNFTSGKLVIEFPQQYGPPAKTVTPADINTTQFIHSSDYFKYADNPQQHGMTVRIRWVKTDGSSVTLGEKVIMVKRNILTKLQVTIPGPGKTSAPAGITVTDSALSF